MDNVISKIINTLNSIIKNDNSSFNLNKQAIINEMYEPIINNKTTLNNTLTEELNNYKKQNSLGEKQLNQILKENSDLAFKLSILEDLVLTK